MKEVIILGCGQTSWSCPYDCETWGVNSMVKRADRLDKLFFFDNLETLPDPDGLNWNDLIETEAALISTEKNAKFCKEHLGIECEVYPLEEICAKYKNHYFSNSISYMIAYAIYKGYDKIKVYGVDHVRYESYVMERSGVEFWLGIAIGAGIDVEIAAGSALLKTFNGKLYGYEFFYQDYPVKDMLSNIIVA